MTRPINGIEYPDNLRSANLSGADLSGANLSGADLRDARVSYANLHSADLSGADLRGADLRYVDMRNAVLYGAGLRHADMRHANLSGADLHSADLRHAVLYGANLCDANLRNADLRDAGLRDAGLRHADLRHAVLYGANLCDAGTDSTMGLEETYIAGEGDLIVYKKLQGNVICKLLIPKEAKRSNATGRKCRAEYAVVLEGEGVSQHDPAFKYKVGETVRPREPFDENRWDECGSGIHFFITRGEAESFWPT